MDIFGHPSLKVIDNRCCDFPLLLKRDIEVVQAVHLKDHVYVGGASGSFQDECRLFVYSLSADNWNVLDTGVSHFALAPYKSQVSLIGGRHRDFGGGRANSWSWIYSNKILLLDSTDLELRDEIIPSMQTNRASACAVSSGNHLLVAGGDKEGREAHSIVEVYDSDSNGWSYVSPLPCRGKVKSATLCSDGNLYMHLGDNEQNDIFYASTTVLFGCTHSVEGKCSKRLKWRNLKSHNQDSELTIFPARTHVCSNLITHHDHLILIGSKNRHRSFFCVYSPDARRWVDVADLPYEKYLVKPSVPPPDPHKAHLVSISSKELLLLGELVNSYRRHIICRVSFQTAAITLNSPFTYRDLEKLRFPVLKILEDQYDLDEKLGIEDSHVPSWEFDDQDSAGIWSIKKWIKSPGSKAKDCNWENLLWLLNECIDADDHKTREEVEKLKAYITSIPRCEGVSKVSSDVAEMDTDQIESDSEVEDNDTKALAMVACIRNDIKKLCTDTLRGKVSPESLKTLTTCAETAMNKLTTEFNAIEKDTETLEADIKDILIKNKRK